MTKSAAYTARAAALCCILCAHAARAQTPDPPPGDAAPAPQGDVAPGPEAGASPAPEPQPTPEGEAESAPEPETAPETAGTPEAGLPTPEVTTEPGEAAASASASAPPAEGAATITAPGTAGSEAPDDGVTITSEGAAPSEPEATPSTGEEEEIVITGSRIKRTSFASAAPVEVIGREQLEYSGAQNMGEVVRYLTASSGSEISGNGQGNWGTSTVNLRGLGENATLLLLNGRRLVPSGAAVGFFADLNTIPITAIDRVEILRGGASAIYGADAVAGVVNIITREDWEGARIDASGKTVDELYQRDADLSLSMGGRTEHSHGGLSLAYSRRTPLYARDLDWTRTRDADGNVINRSFIADIGNPATFVTFRPTPAGGPGPHPDPDCEQAPGSFVSEDGDFCSIDFRQSGAIFGDMERVAALGSGEHDLTNHTRAFAELLVSHTTTETEAIASFPILHEVFVPADHVDNTFGFEVQFFGAPLPALLGAQSVTSLDNTLRAVIGLRGDFGGIASGSFAEDWEWELSGSWSESSYHAEVPDTIVDSLQDALNACSDPADLSACYNPFYSAYTGTGTPNSQDVIDSFNARMAWTTDSRLTTADAGLTGTLFQLPGGDAAFAVGTQLRREERATDQGHDAELLRYGFVLGNSDARAGRDVGAGYLELSWPLHEGLEVQTAGRMEHSSVSGTDANPTLGLVITPADLVGAESVPDSLRRLRVRGHAATAFRSPSVYQTVNGFVTGIRQFEGEGVLPVFRPARAFGNPNLQPETAIALSAGIDWSPIEELALTTDLWHYSYEDLIVTDNALRLHAEDLRISGNSDYVNMAVCETLPCVRRDSSGNLLGVDTVLENKPEIQTTGLDFGALATIDLGGSSTLIGGLQGTYVLSYIIPREDVPDVELMGGAIAEVEGCDADGCDVAGRLNTENFAASLPRLKVNLPLTWTDFTHSIALVAHYISAYEDDNDPDRSPQDTDNPVARFAEIEAYFTLDASYGYNLADVIGTNARIHVGVLNLTDTDPPLARGLPGYDSGTVDPRGRMLYTKLTLEL